jgi:hypothetical protein
MTTRSAYVRPCHDTLSSSDRRHPHLQYSLAREPSARDGALAATMT